MTKALRSKPSLVFLPYIANVGLYLFLQLRGARGTGIFISALMAAAGLVFLYLIIKKGFVWGRGARYSIDGDPRAIWASAGFCFCWYLVVTLAAVAFYFQDRAPGGRG
ncbi:MAG: hypothetical protein HYV95_10705 [Opitutae bacterium]|nr:hypothetical protein [Opitutae bacterium]